jgi:hypothetical protein
MTQVGGLDVLIAWAMFAALFGSVAFFLLRERTDPVEEMKKHVDESEPHTAHQRR